MASVATEILIVLVLVLANGIFAMSEMAVVSSRKGRLQQLANEGDLGAKAALELAESPNRFLSTVQTGITLIGIFAGAFGGATISEKLAELLQQVPLLAPYSASLALGLVVTIISYLSLVVGELIPKRFALSNPERIAGLVARPMGIVSQIASPVISLLSLSTELGLRLLRVKETEEAPVTEEEIKVLIEQGTLAGMFEEAEQDIVQRVFRLGDRQVKALMTPRPDIIWLDLDESEESNRTHFIDSVYSRFPVCRESLSQVLGVVQVKDLLARALAGKPLDLTTTLRQPLFIPGSTHALRVLESFKQSGTHIALVVDEFGDVQGLVTLNDILEALVGDLPAAGEEGEKQAIQREDGSWLLDGMVPIDELEQSLGRLPPLTRGSYQTLGGMIMAHLGHIPRTGECFAWGGLNFEILDMDGNRIDKVLVQSQVNQED